MAKVFDTLAPDGVQHYEAFHHAGFVVATLPFLHPDVLPYAGRQSQRPERLHHQGTPPHAVSISGSGSGSTSNSNGDSVGDGWVGFHGFFTPKCYLPDSPLG